MSRPGPILKLLLLGLLLAVMAGKIFRSIHAAHLSNVRSPAALQIAAAAPDPWAAEPVTEPILAETLLRGATVEYYEVDGNTREELQANLSVRGLGLYGAEAKTSYHLVLHKGDPSDVTCGFAKSFVAAEITVLAPRWISMPNQTDDAKKWWAYHLKDLVRRQQGSFDQVETVSIADNVCNGTNRQDQINHRNFFIGFLTRQTHGNIGTQRGSTCTTFGA